MKIAIAVVAGCVLGFVTIGAICSIVEDKAPVVAAVPEAIIASRTPAGHLMIVLTDGKSFYVADGAGVNVFDPNVVHRLTVAEPNEVDPNE